MTHRLPWSSSTGLPWTLDIGHSLVIGHLTSVIHAWQIAAGDSLRDRKIFLLLCFLQLVLPFLDATVNAAERQQFLFVVDHFFAREADQRIIFHQENRFLRADFLAIAAEDAAQHVNLKFLWRLLDVAHLRRAVRSRRRDPNGLGRTHEL